VARVRLRVTVDAPPSAVWNDLADIARHTEWMADAVAIEFVGDQRRGLGTRFDCLTRVGPFRTRDRMVITEWTEGQEMGVRHTGMVSGHGRFVLEPQTAPGEPARTLLSWDEELRFPWYMGGRLGAALAARLVFPRLWRGNLRRFAARFSGAPAA
jgi:hypothetical protein